MHNHYHIVVGVDNERIAELPTKDVIFLWSHAETTLLPIDPSELLSTCIPFAFDVYLELVDVGGRVANLQSSARRYLSGDSSTPGNFYQHVYHLRQPVSLSFRQYRWFSGEAD